MSGSKKQRAAHGQTGTAARSDAGTSALTLSPKHVYEDLQKEIALFTNNADRWAQSTFDQVKQFVIQHGRPGVHDLADLNSLRQQIVNTARKTLTTMVKPGATNVYTVGGDNPQKGFDCSGFVRYVFLGVFPEYDRNTNTAVISSSPSVFKMVDAPLPGDLIFFPAGHFKDPQLIDLKVKMYDGQLSELELKKQTAEKIEDPSVKAARLKELSDQVERVMQKKKPWVKTVDHVGIVVDSNTWTSSQSKGLADVKMDDKYWGQRVARYYRYFRLEVKR
jgi:hypothetical protein